MNVYIKENSWIAQLAAMKLKANSCAIVMGSTIHLHNATREDLVKNSGWLRHEVCHVHQWKRNTYLWYPIHYLWLSILYGYQKNPYEVEAREASVNETILEGVVFK